MKFEKVNDRQFRCTLSKQELEQRNLKMSEIAYGNAKVRALFSDMMRQASLQFGFEAENIPLMIEVIPFSEYVMVQVTKVEDPEELDVRYSKFAPGIQSDEDEDSENGDSIALNFEDGIKELFKKLGELKAKTAEKIEKESEETVEPEESLRCFCSFDSLNMVIKAAGILKVDFEVENVLYKNSADNTYLLRLEKGDLADSVFLKICSVLSEYGHLCPDNGFLKYFVNEHYSVLVPDNALMSLAQIG